MMPYKNEANKVFSQTFHLHFDAYITASLVELLLILIHNENDFVSKIILYDSLR